MADQIARRMAPYKPFVLVADQFDGTKFSKSFRLCFDFAAFARVKEKTGLELWNSLEAWAKTSEDSSRILPVLLWAAVCRNHPEYAGEDGLDALASYIDPRNAGAIGDAVFEAYLLSVPKELADQVKEAIEKANREEESADPTGEVPKKEAEPPETSAGMITGPSPDTTSA